MRELAGSFLEEIHLAKDNIFFFPFTALGVVDIQVVQSSYCCILEHV